MKTFQSAISKKEFPLTDKVSGKTIRRPLLEYIQQDHPDFTPDDYLAFSELNRIREQYISDYLTKQIGTLTELDKTVLSSLTNNDILADQINTEDDTTTSFGQKIADKVASFGGSWTFILSFGAFIFIWIFINAIWLTNKGFDPYPFILLNLMLSCLAALQAPVIMMSQNRQEEKDRERGKKDYMINLKSELEIRTLHEKIDHMIMHQQQELMEIQKFQIEMLNDILSRIPATSESEENDTDRP